MENNSQPPAPAAPAKATPPANEPPKNTQASSNHEVVPMVARTAATDGSAAQPQRGTAVDGSAPLRSVQQHPQPLSGSLLQVLAEAGTGTGAMYGTTAVGSPACRPMQQTNPVVFGQGSSSSNQAMQGPSSSAQGVAATALAAATYGPSPAALFPARRVVRRKKLKIKRPSSPPPPKLPVYRLPPPPRPELAGGSATGNAQLQSSSDTSLGFRVSNMQADADPPSPHQGTVAEEGADSAGGGGSGDDVEMLDLNFPPVSNNKEN